jgi:hypothetical protein
VKENQQSKAFSLSGETKAGPASFSPVYLYQSQFPLKEYGITAKEYGITGKEYGITGKECGITSKENGITGKQTRDNCREYGYHFKQTRNTTLTLLRKVIASLRRSEADEAIC